MIKGKCRTCAHAHSTCNLFSDSEWVCDAKRKVHHSTLGRTIIAGLFCKQYKTKER